MNLPAQWPPEIKKTRQRRLVWQALLESELPLTAADLSARLGRRETPVSLSTVYRVLDTFAEKGFVVKTAVLDDGTILYEAAGGSHRHYAVCLGCHRVVAVENCPMDSFAPQLGEGGFQVMGHRLQMYGYCAHCGVAQGRGE